MLSLTSCGDKIPENWAEGVNWSGKTSESAYNSFSSEARHHTVQLVEAYLPNSWNSPITFKKEDGQFIANVVDGLLYVDEYNKLVPELATAVPAPVDKGDHYEFTFTIKENANWVENKDYGNKVVAPVMGQDFVTALEANLNYGNGSQSSYLPQMFIAGASEYNSYTRYAANGRKANKAVIKDGKVAGICDPQDKESGCDTISGTKVDIPNPDTNEAGFHEFLIQYKVLGNAVTLQDLPNVKNFSRVGVKADGKSVTYTLTGKQEYFKTVVSYTPFLPVPTDYYKANQTSYGLTARNILSCGAYVVSSKYKDKSSTSLTFEKNMNYHSKETVKNAKVIVRTPTSQGGKNELRKLYEGGQVDGFTVAKADSEGWSKYVTGADGKGTIGNPAHPDAYSTESIGDGSTYAFMINTYRTYYAKSMVDKNATAHLDLTEEGNNLELIKDRHGNTIPSVVNNTNIALTYSPKLRQAILTSLDPTVYYRYRTLAFDSYEDRKLAVNTWTPHDFITYDTAALTVDNHDVLGYDYNDYVKVAYIERELMGNPAETKSDAYSTLEELYKADPEYGQVFVDAANDALGYSGYGGLNMKPTFKDGAFTGFEKSTTKTYKEASGYGVTDVGPTKHGLGNGSFVASSTPITTSEADATWYSSASRDTESLQKLVEEGIKEAEANYKATTGTEYKIKTPIVVEFPGLDFNPDSAANSATTYNMANMMLNGFPIKDESNDDVIEQYRTLGLGKAYVDKNGRDADEAKVLLVKQSTKNMPQDTDYTAVANNYNYNMIVSGWGPDYSDPMTYAHTNVKDGDMQDALGTHTYLTTNSELRNAELDNYVVNGYDELVYEADSKTDPIERAKIFAEAEVQMLYHNFLLRPIEMKGQGYSVKVSKYFAKGVTTASYGLSSYKYKGYEVLANKKAIPGSKQAEIYNQIQAIRKGLQ